MALKKPSTGSKRFYLLGLILDAGCGGHPIRQADVTCDLYFSFEDPDHNPSNVVIKGNFLICDLHCLPFRIKVFSYVNCTHVLEHVLSPQKVYSELRRVSEHGYIETPNHLYETLIFGWRGHLWCFFKHNGKLFFKPVKRLKVKNFILLPLGWLIQLLNNLLKIRKVNVGRFSNIQRRPFLFVSYSW